MKAFVTGGTGFVGSHLIDFLLKKDFHVYALVRNLSLLKWLEGKNIHFLEGNLFSIPKLPSDLDFVFHIAGLTKTSKTAKYYTVNVQGTASLFQSLSAQNITPKSVVCLSSLAASGPSLDGKPVSEDDFPRPITPYGISKLEGEKEALKYKDKLPVVIVRAGAVYGPRDKDFLHYFKLIEKRILPSPKSSQKPLSLCYVKDLVRAVYLCTQKNLTSGEIFHISDSRPYTWDEIGRAAGQALGKKLRVVRIPLPAAFLWALIAEAAGRMKKKPSIFNRNKYKEMRQPGWVADVQKAEEKLSFKPEYSLEDGIRETIQWYLEHKWL